MSSRFRWRTRLREALPHRSPLYRLVPKGGDCGEVPFSAATAVLAALDQE